MGRKRNKASVTTEPAVPTERVALPAPAGDDLPFDPIEPLPDDTTANAPETPTMPAGDDVEEMAWSELLAAIKAEKDVDTAVDFLPPEVLKQGGAP